MYKVPIYYKCEEQRIINGMTINQTTESCQVKISDLEAHKNILVTPTKKLN